MSTALIFARDKNGFNTFIVSHSSQTYSAFLATGVSQTLTVPSESLNNSKRIVAVIASNQGGNVWVCINGTATIPAGAFSQTDSDLNPPGLIVNVGDVISFITNDAIGAYVNVKFYSDIT
jgi:hypothetical protein